jgi:type III restriction enzyme
VERFGFRELRRIVDTAVERLVGDEPELQGRLALVKYGIRDRLARFIEDETDRQTHDAFVDLHRAGNLCFWLECVECRFELPPEIEIRSTRRLVHEDHSQVERSLFDIVPEESLNPYERAIALFLDRHEQVLWWYRNEVGAQNFSIQGYRRSRIYPDFVVQTGNGTSPSPTVLVVESKGDQLAGNVDTSYKRDVASYFEALGKSVSWQKLGKDFHDSTFRFQIVQESSNGHWKDRLLELLGR